MSSLEFAEILNDLTLYAGFLPVVAAMVFWKFQKNEMKVFAINQIIWVLIFLFSIYLQKHNVKNHFVNYLHDLRIVLFVFLMYWIYDKNPLNRRILVALGFVVFSFVLVQWLFFQQNEWSGYTDTIVTLSVIFVSGFYLKKIINSYNQSLFKIPFWWIVTTILITFFVNLFSNYFSKSALEYSTEVFLLIWNIISIIAIISKVLFAYGFYISKKYHLP